MSVLGDILNDLGQDILPDVAEIVFPDTCSIQTNTVSKSSTGGNVKGAVSNYKTSVPCSYAPAKKDWREEQAGKPRSVNEYIVKIPTHLSGSRIDFDITAHRIVTDTRGNEPAKTFRPIAVRDISGVIFEIVCEKEN